MVGLQLSVKVAPILDDLEAAGVLAMRAGPRVLRFLPPLVISWPELSAVARIVKQILARYG